MKALLLYQPGWAVGASMNPSWKSLNQSFEGWAYRNGLLRQIHQLPDHYDPLEEMEKMGGLCGARSRSSRSGLQTAS